MFLIYIIAIIYRLNKSLTHRIYVQQVYRRCKNGQSLSSIDTSNLQTMQDSNYYYNFILNIFVFIIMNYSFIWLVKQKLNNIMGISGKYENEDRSWLSEYLPKEQNELPSRSMNVSININTNLFNYSMKMKNKL